MAVSSSTPLRSRDTRPLHLDDIGAYFSMVVKEIDIVQSTLSFEVGTVTAAWCGMHNYIHCIYKIACS